MDGQVACKEMLGCRNTAMIIHLGAYLDQIQHMCGGGGPAKTCGCPRLANNLASPTGLATIFDEACPHCVLIFGEIISRVENPDLTGAIFLIIPVNS
jgi:hypothetical protein